LSWLRLWLTNQLVDGDVFSSSLPDELWALVGDDYSHRKSDEVSNLGVGVEDRFFWLGSMLAACYPFGYNSHETGEKN
jgi:hypothetical protein